MDYSNDTILLIKYSIVQFGISNECVNLHIFGTLELLLFIMCIVFNSVLLKIFFINKKLRTKFTKLIVVLTLNNLLGSIFIFPFTIISKFYCKWIFGQFGCVFVGKF